jgi:phage-related protein
MSYAIEFFNASVQSDVEMWPVGIYASFTRIAEKMVDHGPNLGMPYTKSFGEGLFEIRARGTEGIGRAFYCVIVGRRIIILHGFIKKSQETPAYELKVARKRLKELQHGK